MSFNYLTTSTSKTGIYSSGAFLQDSTPQWNQNPQGADLYTRDLESWSNPPLRALSEYTGGTVGTAYADPPIRYAFHRILDIMLMQLPPEGIQELIEAMKDIYEFHMSRLEGFNETKPQVQQLKAVIESTQIRPEFPVVGDED